MRLMCAGYIALFDYQYAVIHRLLWLWNSKFTFN